MAKKQDPKASKKTFETSKSAKSITTKAASASSSPAITKHPVKPEKIKKAPKPPKNVKSSHHGESGSHAVSSGKIDMLSTKVSHKKQPKKEIKLPSNIYKGHVSCVKTARHYGFLPFEFSVEKSDVLKAKGLKDRNSRAEHSTGVLSFENFMEEKVAILRNYVEKKMQDLHQPPTICFSGPLKGNSQGEKTREHVFNIDSIGNSKSIADAVVIETAYVILKENHDYDQLVVEINSVGDRDSFSRFTREFVQYYKKHIADLPAELKNLFKKDPFLLAQFDHEALIPFKDEAPKPIDFLSEESRAHFREVLEYLESLGMPYSINEYLVGTRNCSAGTVFQIIGIEEKSKGEKRTTLAIGERYNSVARKALGKKEIPAIGAHILVDDKDAKKSDTFIIEEDIKFYFIHLGYEAKLRSLSILELLRVSKISVHQALAKDKITVQLQAAEKLGVPYILLVGQKEAIENSVTVRHVDSRIQETIPVHALIEYLKKL